MFGDGSDAIPRPVAPLVHGLAYDGVNRQAWQDWRESERARVGVPNVAYVLVTAHAAVCADMLARFDCEGSTIADSWQRIGAARYLAAVARIRSHSWRMPANVGHTRASPCKLAYGRRARGYAATCLPCSRRHTRPRAGSQETKRAPLWAPVHSARVSAAVASPRHRRLSTLPVP